jgi:predicted ferric reductase
MTYSLRRAILWLVIFTLLALIPLAIGYAGEPPRVRSFAVELGVAFGFLGLSLMALQLLFSGRLRWIAPRFGMDNIIQYHREMGWIGAILVLLHPVILIAADGSFLAYFDPRVNFLRAVFLIFVTLAVIAIIATSVWRPQFRLEYEWWRLAHGVLAMAIVFIGLVHAIQVRHYLAPFWKQAMLAVLVGGTLYAVVHTRITRPWLMRRRPWRVVGVEPERNQGWSLTVEPAGHEGMRFTAGQFAWITIRDSPFTLQQHPFSIASSARRRELTFTAKEFGDFTGSWKRLEPGTRAYLEGPFGSFTPDPDPATGLFLVMGGIGITPAMGILRTLRDDADRRPAILIYGNKDWENIAFREELGELEQALNLRVVHLLEEPPDDWQGESGFVTRELLEKHLPPEPDTFQYFICGPKPLMDITEIELRDLGIGWTRIYSERFNIV